MTDNQDLTAGLVVRPGIDFPLPPPELADALDNSQPDAPAPVAATAATVDDDGLVLDFIDGKPGISIPLLYPFRHEGREVREVFVSPLPVAAVGRIVTASGGRIDNYAFYAEMTGLPAAVLRAMPGVDGDLVTDAAYGFLPRFLKAEGPASPSTPESGGF